MAAPPPDPEVSNDDVIGTMAQIVESGTVAMVGLCNADPDQIRTAHTVLSDALVSVQNQFSPAFRSSGPEIEVCHELGLAFLAWSPLGGLADAKQLAVKHPAFAQVARTRAATARNKSPWHGNWRRGHTSYRFLVQNAPSPWWIRPPPISVLTEEAMSPLSA